MTTSSRRRGRPARPDARRRPISVRLSDTEHRELERIARENQQTLTDFIREAVSEAVADCSDDVVFARPTSDGGVSAALAI